MVSGALDVQNEHRVGAIVAAPDRFSQGGFAPAPGIDPGAPPEYPRFVYSVIVADDHSIVREGLRRILEAEEDLSVCGEAGDGREVLQVLTELSEVGMKSCSLFLSAGVKTTLKCSGNGCSLSLHWTSLY